MQREAVRRGFTIHQKVVLELDFAGTLAGYTEITLEPTSKDLKTINLHSRQCDIQAITVSGHRAEFSHYDPIHNVARPDKTHPSRTIASYPEVKRSFYSALSERDEGELSIAIPRQVPVKLCGGASLPRIEGTPEPSLPSLDGPPLTIKIEYILRNSGDGFHFVTPTDTHPYLVPHAFTTPASPDAARCWVPCVDNLWERCTWDFEFIVPRSLDASDDDAMEIDNSTGEHSVVVVCSGELSERVNHPSSSTKSIFLYQQTVPTSVQHIAWAAGPFHILPINADRHDNTGDDTSSQPQMHAFCLPGREAALTSSVSFYRTAMNFYTSEFGSYPYGSHKVVFVDELPTQRFDTSTLSLITSCALHEDDAIDQVFETRHLLSHALACQWVGINIYQKTWSDTWLVNGLGLYITGLFLRRLFGNNEYRFRLKKDMYRVVEADVGAMPPICQPTVLEPPDASVLGFINLKSPLVLHALDRLLGKSGTSLGLSRVLPKLFLSAISGELPHNALSTHSFLRTCRKVSGVDLRVFADQWIYGSGCPLFTVQASFNRKKMAIEIQVQQDVPAYSRTLNDPVSQACLRPAKFFEGQMTVRIHEADGTPYEHVLDIRQPYKKYEVPFNTKYKRVRRNTKRFLARQAAAAAAADGDIDAAEDLGMIDMGFGLGLWEEERERENWKVADWTDDDERHMAGATYEWIRMDADFEWITAIHFDQPDFMWVSQLQRDRDVVAQLEAVHALARKPSAIVSSTLTKTVLVTNYFFRIRMEAALALVTCATRSLEFLGLFHLFKLFLKFCYPPETRDQDLFRHKYVPKPNDFSDLPEYFIRKSLIIAISRVRIENGKTLPIVRQFLIDQLRFNDNSSNQHSDGLYISTVISSLGSALVSTTPPERGELLPHVSKAQHNAEDAELLRLALLEVERYRNMDRLIPSTHNVVTIAALEFNLILSIANLIPNDPKLYLNYTREGNNERVRLAALDGLLLMKWFTPGILSYVLALMDHDPSRVVRRYVARSLCESLAILFTIEEIKPASKEPESVLIEEDGSNPGKIKESRKSEVDLMIKTLRKDREIGKQELLRRAVMRTMISPDVDHEVRWCLLKLADITCRGAEEQPPKFTVRLPATPIIETPTYILPTPAVVKPKGSLKLFIGKGSTTKSTLSPINVQSPQPIEIPAPSPGPSTRSTVLLSKDKDKPVPLPAPEPKKKVKVKASQTTKVGVLSKPELRACQNAVKKLLMHPSSLYFRYPVDPIRDGAPDYFNVIKDPMDLTTLTSKLPKLPNREAFESEIRLITENARRYNLPGSVVHAKATEFEVFFNKEWTRINKTLQAVDKSKASKTDPHEIRQTLPHELALPIEPVPPAKARPAQSALAPLPPSPPVPVQPAPSIGSTSTLPDIRPALPPSSHPSLKLKLTRPSVKVPEPAPAPIPPTHLAVPLSDMDEIEAALIETGAIAVNDHSSLAGPPTSKPSPNMPTETESVDDELFSEVLAIENSQRAIPPKKKDRLLSEKAKGKAKNTTSSPSTPEPSKPKSIIISKPKKSPTEAVPSTISVKGKEKEPIPKPESGVKPPPIVIKKSSSASATPVSVKKCEAIINLLLKVHNAGFFARPVDIVLDQCPDYYKEITNPMDFKTMRAKLHNKIYKTMEQFADDVKLIIANAHQFNPPGTLPWLAAEDVGTTFQKEWSKIMETEKPTMTPTEKSAMKSLINQLLKEEVSLFFREAVDPVALGIPTYFQVIKRKDARDFGLVKSKLEKGQYESVEALEADVHLMVRNAHTFNPPDDSVYHAATALLQRFNTLLATFRKKRKDESSLSSNSKKPRLA